MPEPVFPSDDVVRTLATDQATIAKVLQAAWRAICKAGVLRTETDEGVRAMPYLTMRVADGQLRINNLR